MKTTTVVVPPKIEDVVGSPSLPSALFTDWFRAHPDTIYGEQRAFDEWAVGGYRMYCRCQNPEMTPECVRRIVLENSRSERSVWVLWLLAKNSSFPLLTLEDPMLLVDLLNRYCYEVECLLTRGLSMQVDSDRVIFQFYCAAWAVYGKHPVIGSVMRNRTVLQRTGFNWRRKPTSNAIEKLEAEFRFISCPDVFDVIVNNH